MGESRLGENKDLLEGGLGIAAQDGKESGEQGVGAWVRGGVTILAMAGEAGRPFQVQGHGGLWNLREPFSKPLCVREAGRAPPWAVVGCGLAYLHVASSWIEFIFILLFLPQVHGGNIVIGYL